MYSLVLQSFRLSVIRNLPTYLFQCIDATKFVRSLVPHASTYRIDWKRGFYIYDNFSHRTRPRLEIPRRQPTSLTPSRIYRSSDAASASTQCSQHSWKAVVESMASLLRVCSTCRHDCSPPRFNSLHFITEQYHSLPSQLFSLYHSCLPNRLDSQCAITMSSPLSSHPQISAKIWRQPLSASKTDRRALLQCTTMSTLIHKISHKEDPLRYISADSTLHGTHCAMHRFPFLSHSWGSKAIQQPTHSLSTVAPGHCILPNSDLHSSSCQTAC